MRKRRQSQQDEIYSSSQDQHSTGRARDTEGCLVKLVSAFDEVFKVKEWMVPLGEANKAIGNSKLIGETFIISGPAQSGKSSLVYWVLRDDPDTVIVTVDCSLYKTDLQFIQRLTKDLGEKIGASSLDRRVVASENIKFSDLNPIIEEQGFPVVILIRNAQKLVEIRKQILLYNLLEWIMTDAKKMVGIVFTTRLMFFVDRFEKRVRSRLAAKQITVVRPQASSLHALLVRRVECLLESERNSGDDFASILFQKVLACMHKNEQLLSVIQKNQEIAHKDIVYYLNVMKIVFSSFKSAEQIMEMSDSQLKKNLCMKLQDSFAFIFPFIPINLLKTCTYPQFLIIAIINHMHKHGRQPYRFKTVFQIYLQFRQRCVQQQGNGSAFTYSKNVLQRSVLKLEELKLIELDSRDESLWNCDIKCVLYPSDIDKAFKQIENLPDFIKDIIKS